SKALQVVDADGFDGCSSNSGVWDRYLRLRFSDAVREDSHYRGDPFEEASEGLTLGSRMCRIAVSTEVRTTSKPRKTRSTPASEITRLPRITTPAFSTWSRMSSKVIS